MLKLKVYSNKDNELVRFVTPDTYVSGGNFAKLASKGQFERAETVLSRDKFYLATAIAVMIALEGKYHAQLSYGKFCGQYAAWTEVEFRGEDYIIDPVKFRDIVIPENELGDVLDVVWSCNYKEIERHSAVISVAEAMSTAETSKDVLSMIAAVRILERR